MKKVVLGSIIALALAACGPAGAAGSITFNPSTESCSSPAPWTETIQLPSSVHATDNITATFDGKTISSAAVSSSGLTQKSDGSWTGTSQLNASEIQTGCAAGGVAGGLDLLTPGTHTFQYLDSSGKVLAQGSYTVTN